MDDSPNVRALSALHKTLNMTQTPFPFPLGLGLFDADPSKLLSLLHHQTLLAEEALR